MRKGLEILAMALVLSVGGGAAGAQSPESANPESAYLASALRLLRPLAEQGNAEAQLNLGFMYANGKGVAQDYGEALKWYGSAAKQGNAAAQTNLGLMYANGQGVAQDYGQAASWFRRAAEQGLPKAQLNLGISYAKGQGVVRDYLRAHMWFSVAASKLTGDDGQQAVTSRDTIEKALTPEQLQRARVMAQQCEASSFTNCN